MSEQPAARVPSAWGAFLGQRMRDCGLDTNRDLARASGVPESVISRWRNQGVTPSVEQLRRLRAPLELSILELLVAAGYLSAEEAAVPEPVLLPPAPTSGVVEALAEDDALPEPLRQSLIEHYRALVALAEHRAPTA